MLLLSFEDVFVGCNRQVTLKLKDDEIENFGMTRQGNLHFYTKERLQQRASLKQNATLKKMTLTLWNMPSLRDPKLWFMTVQGYRALMLRLHKLLVHDFNLEDVEEIIRVRHEPTSNPFIRS